MTETETQGMTRFEEQDEPGLAQVICADDSSDKTSFLHGASLKSTADKEKEAQSLRGAPSLEIPEELDQRYRIQKSMIGAYRYFNRESNQEAFRDYGNRIIVKQASEKELVPDIMSLVEAKGWSKIKLSGPRAFKQSVWLLASQKGLEVSGYKPTEQDLRLLKRYQDNRVKREENAKSHATIETKKIPAELQAKKETASPEKLNKTEAHSAVASTPKASPVTKKTKDPLINDELSVNKPIKAAQGTKSTEQVVKDSAALKKRENELREAYTTQSKHDAIKTHKELAGLYPFVAATRKVAEKKWGPGKEADKFTERVETRAIQELAKGGQLPKTTAQPVTQNSLKTQFLAQRARRERTTEVER